ncbi:hydrogenase nickel incorporation protein HypB [Aneurinibacillus terranovensis]|uniref:hydrogenase nickel incorporation protein HypB n=1 Tax=Aneurinibacillus terranovensis TaxID=278991 RepID=UPI0003FD809A|nr:hydrogenase nickel incorporation protein HypB [Aneurinibacillus terranovensis]
MRIDVKNSVLAENQKSADALREMFAKNDILVLNIMSSPGAGKTSLLVKTIQELSKEYRIGVIEGDLATTLDADRIRAVGAQTVQLNTGGGCHLDARMVEKANEHLDMDVLDILFIENVGNLVCPSGYDLGQNHKIVVLSVPEGNDKIPKYPHMFRRTELVLLNKIDLLPYLDFNTEQAAQDLSLLNPSSAILPLSAKTGEGFDAWIRWIKEKRDAICRP